MYMESNQKARVLDVPRESLLQNEILEESKNAQSIRPQAQNQTENLGKSYANYGDKIKKKQNELMNRILRDNDDSSDDDDEYFGDSIVL